LILAKIGEISALIFFLPSPSVVPYFSMALSIKKSQIGIASSIAFFNLSGSFFSWSPLACLSSWQRSVL